MLGINGTGTGALMLRARHAVMVVQELGRTRTQLVRFGVTQFDNEPTLNFLQRAYRDIIANECPAAMSLAEILRSISQALGV